MRFFLIILSAVLITGCSVTPYKDLDIDSTSNFKSPTKGKAGIYVYQWKSGIIGAISDVDFEIKGYPEISLNTGEYGYFELPPGEYEYKGTGGLLKQYGKAKFEANQNYFFRAFFNMGDYILWVKDQVEINEAKSNIKNGRYEKYSVD